MKIESGTVVSMDFYPLVFLDPTLYKSGPLICTVNTQGNQLPGDCPLTCHVQNTSVHLSYTCLQVLKEGLSGACVVAPFLGTMAPDLLGLFTGWPSPFCGFPVL